MKLKIIEQTRSGENFREAVIETDMITMVEKIKHKDPEETCVRIFVGDTMAISVTEGKHSNYTEVCQALMALGWLLKEGKK